MGWVQCVKGSAHTGPALTPAEVLIALHGIDPHRDSVSLKKVSSIDIHFLLDCLCWFPYCFRKAISYSRTDVKIMETWLGMGEQVMDACSACLQQRTVFTQQVLAKVLNQLVWSCTCVWCLGSQKSLNGAWSASSFVLMGILTFCTLLFLCYMKTLTHSDSLCACLSQCLNCLDSSSIWLLVC